ncbi:MAG: carbohydrate kinase [Muribaculaceae bacterium]|nr:carbohydrate kinase [Muribaculaceae bacterium]
MDEQRHNEQNYIVGLGEVLFDCLPSGKQLGGAPANFAFHASQFGLHGIAVSAIGADELGAEVKHLLSEKLLDFHLEEVAYPTGTVQVTLSTGGIPTYDICLGVAYDNIPFTPTMAEIAHNTCCVCFGSLAQRTEVSRNSIMQFLKEVPADALKVFDINLRQNWYSREVVEASLMQCNVLKLNDEEISTLAAMLSLDDVPIPTADHPLALTDIDIPCRTLISKYGISTVILTCGVNGSFVLTANEASYLPTPKVQVADTVGAGDSFTGAFCAALLSGKPIAEAHRLGVEVSAYVCTQNGAMPTLPPLLTNLQK